jgi:hypothetical protein
MVNVVNKHNHVSSNDDVYIGRGSILGNPYSHLENTKAEFKVINRKTAIDSYNVYIKQKINNKDKNILNELNKIYVKAMQGNVNLVCYCKPLPCHGNIIKKIIEERLKLNKSLTLFSD